MPTYHQHVVRFVSLTNGTPRVFSMINITLKITPYCFYVNIRQIHGKCTLCCAKWFSSITDAITVSLMNFDKLIYGNNAVLFRIMVRQIQLCY